VLVPQRDDAAVVLALGATVLAAMVVRVNRVGRAHLLELVVLHVVEAALAVI
jgi:hypothetical protein